jgi:2'-5' RNA ligase
MEHHNMSVFTLFGGGKRKRDGASFSAHVYIQYKFNHYTDPHLFEVLETVHEATGTTKPFVPHITLYELAVDTRGDRPVDDTDSLHYFFVKSRDHSMSNPQISLFELVIIENFKDKHMCLTFKDTQKFGRDWYVIEFTEQSCVAGMTDMKHQTFKDAVRDTIAKRGHPYILKNSENFKPHISIARMSVTNFCSNKRNVNEIFTCIDKLPVDEQQSLRDYLHRELAGRTLTLDMNHAEFKITVDDDGKRIPPSWGIIGNYSLRSIQQWDHTKVQRYLRDALGAAALLIVGATQEFDVNSFIRMVTTQGSSPLSAVSSKESGDEVSRLLFALTAVAVIPHMIWAAGSAKRLFTGRWRGAAESETATDPMQQS